MTFKGIRWSFFSFSFLHLIAVGSSFFRSGFLFCLSQVCTQGHTCMHLRHSPPSGFTLAVSMTDDKAVRYAAICQPRSRKEQTASKYTWMYTLQDLKDLSLRKNTSLLLRTHRVYNGPTGLWNFKTSYNCLMGSMRGKRPWLICITDMGSVIKGQWRVNEQRLQPWT